MLVEPQKCPHCNNTVVPDSRIYTSTVSIDTIPCVCELEVQTCPWCHQVLWGPRLTNPVLWKLYREDRNPRPLPLPNNKAE